MSTALSTLAASIQGAMYWSVGLTVAGFQPKADVETLAKKLSYTLGSGANQANEVYGSLQTVTHASSVSLDLTALTDPTGQAVTVSSIVGIFIALLGTGDTAPDGTTAGNASSSITIDGTVANGLTSQANSGWLSNATSKFDIPNGGFLAFGVNSAGGVVVDATHKILKIVANDGAVDAKVLVGIICRG